MKQSGRKSGNLSSGAKEPPFRGGLDWEAIRRCHRPVEEAGEPLPEKLQLTLEEIDRRNRGAQNYYGSEKEIEEQKTARRRGGQKSRPAPFDVDEVARLYVEEKMPVNELALKVRSSPATVRKYLVRAEVYEPQRDKHKPTRTPDSYKKKTECINGHDLTVEGARMPSGSCRACKKERGHDYSWDKDPRNPKNGKLTDEKREELNRKERERNAKARLACPDEQCGHAGIKHGDACQVRDCRCTRSHTDLRTFWAEKEEDAA